MLLTGHRPPASLAPLTGCHQTGSPGRPHPDEVWCFLPHVPVSTGLQNTKALSRGPELAPQRWGTHTHIGHLAPSASVLSFGVWDKDHMQLPPLADLASLSNKPSTSSSDQLRLSWLNQSDVPYICGSLTSSHGHTLSAVSPRCRSSPLHLCEPTPV